MKKNKLDKMIEEVIRIFCEKNVRFCYLLKQMEALLRQVQWISKQKYRLF